MRNSKSNSTGYHTRCRLYPSLIDNNKEIVRKLELISSKTFYAKEYQNFIYVENQYGNMTRVVEEGYIITEGFDSKEDIRVNDTVEYEGTNYNVADVRFKFKNSQSEVSRRPALQTIIKLGATVENV